MQAMHLSIRGRNQTGSHILTLLLDGVNKIDWNDDAHKSKKTPPVGTLAPLSRHLSIVCLRKVTVLHTYVLTEFLAHFSHKFVFVGEGAGLEFGIQQFTADR